MVVCVGIIDDHRAMLVGAAAIIESHPGYHVVATGRTVAELVAFRQRVDVVVLDLTLSDGSTTPQNVRELQVLCAPVLVHVADEPLALVHAAARAGAVGMISKADEMPHMMATIAAAARGQLVEGADWTSAIRHRNPSSKRVILSEREVEVFSRYAAGETAEQVAQELYVSRETVLDHVRRIRRKYTAVGRPAVTKVDLFRRALEDGYVHPHS